MPNFLVLDSHFGANCAAFLYANATPTQIGDAFGVADTHATSTAAHGRLVQFQGDLFALAQDGIYKKDDPTSMAGPWTQQIAFASTSLSPSYWGLHAIEVNGVMSLIGVRPAAGIAHKYRWVKYDGTTWTEAAADTAFFSVANTQTAAVIVYHNTIFWVGGNGSTVADSISYDPATDNYTNLQAALGALFLNGCGNMSMCVFEDRLFLIGAYASGGKIFRLCEFNGSAWVSFQTFELASGANWTVSKPSLFTDGTNMWLLAPYDAGGSGWRCWEWDSAMNRSEITATVLPPALRWTGAAGGAYSGTPSTARFSVIYDLNTTPGTTDIYLYNTTSGTAGTGFASYKWNGNAALMTSVDSGGNVDHSLPLTHLTMGERIFTAGELDIKITARVGVFGGEQISFIAYGGGTGRKMKLHYTLEGTPSLLPATLTAPVTGGSATLNTGLNQVEGIAADGATVYTIVWAVRTEGLNSDTRVIRSAEVLV